MTTRSFAPITGNATDAARDQRGWMMGHFMPGEDNPLRTRDVEVKWFTHPAGDVRDEWAPPTGVSTLNILIHGDFVIRFPEQEIPLVNEGDYVLFGPDIAHSYRAIEDSLVLTVRWPSRPPG